MDPDKAVKMAAEVDPDLAARLRFIYEIDRLKSVLRRNLLSDASRNENSAEHSWHLAMVAMAMAPHAAEPVDIERVIRILLVHDIVEVDAGDVDIYDVEARKAKEVEEVEAADRIFGLLPEPEASELRSLWDEYEARATPEARFAYACDRLQPLMLNLGTGGATWHARGVTSSQVKAINGALADGLAGVWPVAERLIDESVADGSLDP
ncbi:MAG: HD domain-containing protein [Acidimicrobiales bacterium]